jgi:dihydroorotate dehydrogenase
MTVSTDPFKEQFGPVWDGAGVRGFSGEGYWYHRFVPGLNFTGSTLVTKTITTFGAVGNMPLTKDYRPKRVYPDCIEVDWSNALALNAVGLSGPSANEFLETGRWQAITEPFLISFMPVLAEDHGLHASEVSQFVGVLKTHLSNFKSKRLGVQVNITCPNAGVDLGALLQKAVPIVNELKRLGFPVVIKLNLLVPPEAAARIARETGCAITIANTIPFGAVLPASWWNYYYKNGSPLESRGYPAGGLSGKVLLSFVADWVQEFRRYDTNTHVNAGGGILKPDDVNVLAGEGASSIFFASVAMLRPWRLHSIIERGHKLLG